MATAASFPSSLKIQTNALVTFSLLRSTGQRLYPSLPFRMCIFVFNSSLRVVLHEGVLCWFL